MLGWFAAGIGLGVYLLPLALTALSAWCLALATGHTVSPPWVRIMGLCVALIACLGLVTRPGSTPAVTTALPERGGMLGYWIRSGLSSLVGDAGAAIVLIAVMLLSLKVALDIFISQALTSLGRPFGALQRLWRRLDREKRTPPIQPLLPTKKVQPKPPPKSIVPKAPRPSQSVSTPPAEPDRQPEVHSDTQASHRWDLPTLASVFDVPPDSPLDVSSLRDKSRAIEQTLASLGLPCRVVEVNPGPTVTQFGVEPGYFERRDRQGNVRRSKVKVSRIQALANDLALALAAPSIRIEAPVPGKSLVGIEVPNAEPTPVTLREVMESDTFAATADAPLAMALGRNVSGDPVAVDLGDLPHLLIAGATGAGKSVCLNAIIACLLCRNTPQTLRLVLVDPKRVELSGYNGVPHLLSRVIVNMKRVVGLLEWLLREMDRRYALLAAEGARHLAAYNELVTADGEAPLPYIVCIIDELADLMMVASDDIERLLCRLAQMARATGIHLVIATQRPSVDVVTGLIKANFPARLAFAVSAAVDSRVILDTPGAERLLGRGDALYMSPDSPNLTRIQGCWVSEAELSRLVAHWQRQAPSAAAPSILAKDDKGLVQQALWPDVEASPAKQDPEDDLLDKATALVREQGRASASLLQRSMAIGYTRASRLIDRMEQLGIVGPAQTGNKPREVLAKPATSPATKGTELHKDG